MKYEQKLWFSFKKMHLKMLSAKPQPCCSAIDMLTFIKNIINCNFFSALLYPNICFPFYNFKCTSNTVPETRNCISAQEGDTIMGLNSVLGLRLPNIAPGGATDEMVTFMSWIVLRKQKYTCMFCHFWILSRFRKSKFLFMSYILIAVAADDLVTQRATMVLI